MVMVPELVNSENVTVESHVMVIFPLLAMLFVVNSAESTVMAPEDTISASITDVPVTLRVP